MAVSLICIRHGEAEHNVRKITNCDPRKKFLLTECGIRQIESAGEKLKDKKIDAIFSSPFPRTIQTAKIINRHHNLKLRIDQRIREVETGIFDGRPVKEFENLFFRDPYNFRPKGGECLMDVAKRISSFLKHLKKNFGGKTVLVVTHGDPLAHIKSHCSKTDLIKEVKDTPKKGRLYKLRLE